MSQKVRFATIRGRLRFMELYEEGRRLIRYFTLSIRVSISGCRMRSTKLLKLSKLLLFCVLTQITYSRKELGSYAICYFFLEDLTKKVLLLHTLFGGAVNTIPTALRCPTGHFVWETSYFYQNCTKFQHMSVIPCSLNGYVGSHLKPLYIFNSNKTIIDVIDPFADIFQHI